jgi:TRAP transporter 4TM/12TM fusion protein
MYYFMLFGAFFAAAGGGQVLIDLGMKISSSGQPGAPAKAAIISSGLFGMVNGSAVANVMMTGVMTIPMMKKTGYHPEEAASVEAVASTGGQIMPPIMGIGAFIMAEMINVPYLKIAVSAIIPALAYYLAIFLVVDFIARKRHIGSDIGGVKIEPILRRLYLLLPIVILIMEIGRGHSMRSAAVSALIALLIINFLRFRKGLNAKGLFECLLDGTRSVCQVAIPTASCGIIIGVVTMSGLATRLSQLIASVGGNNLAFALIIAALGCLLLGMALPSVAAYLTAYILFVPVITALGVHPLAANMFIFYFGVISNITPPVCLASFAAAGLAGSDTWKTGWLAFRYSLTAFLVPFVFVFKPGILLMGSPIEIVTSTLILVFGIFFLAISVTGYLFKPIKLPFRVVLFFVALSIIIPEDISTYIGIGFGIVFLAISLFARKRKGTISA